jgi:hypothetical protein
VVGCGRPSITPAPASPSNSSGYEATIHYLAGPGKTKADLNYMQVGLSDGGGWRQQQQPSGFALTK